VTVHDILAPGRSSLDVDDAATLERYMEWTRDLARMALVASRAMDGQDPTGMIHGALPNELHAAAEAVYPGVVEDS
jgi:hypothetical protein